MQSLQLIWIVIQMIIAFMPTCRLYELTELEKRFCTSPVYRTFAIKYHSCQNIVPELPRLGPARRAPGAHHCDCGRVPGGKRIVGGMNARIGETPWHVGLTRHPKKPFFCGGTIINAQWVLTAAHCFYNFKRRPCAKSSHKKLFAGVGYSDQFKKGEKSFMSPIIQQIVHPEFNCVTMDNDFALIRLSKAIALGARSSVLPVCLPEDDSKNYYYQHAMILGWGLTSENGHSSDTLKKGDVRIFGKYCAIMETRLTDNMICAKGDIKRIDDGTLIEVDTCKGDSGGSLTIQKQGIFTQIGITSFGKGCARLGRPGVYARVSKALPWITEVAGHYCVRK